MLITKKLIPVAFLLSGPLFSQVRLAQAGYVTVAPIEIAPAQAVLISTHGIPARTGLPVSVSIPETELDGFRASIRLGPDSRTPVQFLGIKQTLCAANAPAGCEPLTSFSLMMPINVPPVGTVAELVLTDRGTDVRTIPVRIVPDRIHVVSTCDEIAISVGNDAPGEDCGPVVRRAATGRRVTAQDPARPGETIVVWAWGLGMPGQTTSTPEYGRLTAAMNMPVVRFHFGPADFPFVTAGAGTPVTFAAAFPPTPLYQINITLPASLPPNVSSCDSQSTRSNTTMLISGISSMDAVRLCVLP